jgi:hypothetical protein
MSLLIDNRNPETGSRQPSGPWRELASRRSAGITVGLYWRPDGDEISVQGSDELTGESFVVEPPKNAALAAFYHPYGFRSQEGGT